MIAAPQAIPQMCMAGQYLVNFTPDSNAVLAAPGSTPLNFVSLMSVPLHATGLTNNNVYHIIVQPLGNCDQYNITQIAMSSTAPTAAYGTGLGQVLNVSNDQTTGGNFVAGQNILPTYMYEDPQSGWDTPTSGRWTYNTAVTYSGGVITMTSLSNTSMEITTLNQLVEPGWGDPGEPDISGQYSIPVIPGVSYTFSCTIKCAATPQTIYINLLFGDSNGNNLETYGGATGTDSTGGITLSATAIAPANAAFAALDIEVWETNTTGEVHTISNIALNQNFGCMPLSLFVTGKNLRPVHVLDDIVNNQPDAWSWITYDYSGKPVQIGECVMPRVNLLAPNDSNFGGPIEGTVAGWTAGASTALAVWTGWEIPFGAPLPFTPSVPAWPVINAQQCAYMMKLTNSSGGSAAVSATTPTGTSGYPVVVGDHYTAFAYFDAGTTSRTCTMSILWYTAAGAACSHASDSGTGVVDVNTGWVQGYVNAVAPATAAYAAVKVSIASTASGEIHGVTCVSFALDNSLQSGLAVPQLAYFEPGAGPGGMRNLIALGYDSATSQLVTVTPNNPLTYFGTGLTATYTDTGMTDTQAVWPMNGLVGLMISAPASLTSSSNSASTTAVVAFNIGNTIILTSAGWSNGQPTDGSQYSIE